MCNIKLLNIEILVIPVTLLIDHVIKLLYLVYYISLHNQNQKRKIKNQKFKIQKSKIKNQKFKIQKSKIKNSKKKNCTFQPNGTP